MNLSITPASLDERLVLENLFQLYAYDFSEILGGDVAEDGRFPLEPLTPYWEEDWRHPYLLRVDAKLAGFALVHRRSRISGDTHTWDMAEFLVMRSYRRRGVGRLAATRLFEMCRGPWEVRQRRENVDASAFWRRTIRDFTGGRFDEATLDDERWRGHVQSFVS